MENNETDFFEEDIRDNRTDGIIWQDGVFSPLSPLFLSELDETIDRNMVSRFQYIKHYGTVADCENSFEGRYYFMNGKIGFVKEYNPQCKDKNNRPVEFKYKKENDTIILTQ